MHKFKRIIACALIATTLSSAAMASDNPFSAMLAPLKAIEGYTKGALNSLAAISQNLSNAFSVNQTVRDAMGKFGALSSDVTALQTAIPLKAAQNVEAMKNKTFVTAQDLKDYQNDIANGAQDTGLSTITAAQGALTGAQQVIAKVALQKFSHETSITLPEDIKKKAEQGDVKAQQTETMIDNYQSAHTLINYSLMQEMLAHTPLALPNGDTATQATISTQILNDSSSVTNFAETATDSIASVMYRIISSISSLFYMADTMIQELGSIGKLILVANIQLQNLNRTMLTSQSPGIQTDGSTFKNIGS